MALGTRDCAQYNGITLNVMALSLKCHLAHIVWYIDYEEYTWARYRGLFGKPFYCARKCTVL